MVCSPSREADARRFTVGCRGAGGCATMAGMKTRTHYLKLNLPQERGFLNITPHVVEAVRASGVREGLCLVNSMHITSSVFINDNEAGLHHDFLKWVEELAPFNP